MNRRGFLGFLGAAIAGATLDPEKALWEPGKKLISIPKPASIALRLGDVVEFDGFYAINPVTRCLAIDPETGKPFRARYVIVDHMESSHPSIFPSMIPEGMYKNVAMPRGFRGTNRPPREFMKVANQPRFPVDVVANIRVEG